MLEKILYYAATFAEAGLAVFGLRDVYEQPKYSVRERLNTHLEIREYGPRVLAEATVMAPQDRQAINIAFNLLFDYITGANEASRLVAMTAPVQQAIPPERLAMVTPVQVDSISDSEGNQFSMRFFLPAAVADNPPRPIDPRVRIITMPPTTVAVLRFSGPLDVAAQAARKRELLDRLSGTDWRSMSEPYVLAYDPPFTIPFLRRNEIAVDVTAR